MKNKITVTILVLAVGSLSHGTTAFAAIPVTDGANLANNQIAHITTIAKWVESIAQLKNQITHLRQQIEIQDDLRNWTGNPAETAGSLALDILSEEDLTRDYGAARDDIARDIDSLGTLSRTDDEVYRSVAIATIDGGAVEYDPLTYRRHTLLDARADNMRAVADETREREYELLEETALTLGELRSAANDAQVQKITAKLIVLNGQLSQIETARRRQVDEVILQKIANDNRREIEQLAAAELASHDDAIATERVKTFLRTINPRKTTR